MRRTHSARPEPTAARRRRQHGSTTGRHRGTPGRPDPQTVPPPTHGDAGTAGTAGQHRHPEGAVQPNPLRPARTHGSTGRGGSTAARRDGTGTPGRTRPHRPAPTHGDAGQRDSGDSTGTPEGAVRRTHSARPEPTAARRDRHRHPRQNPTPPSRPNPRRRGDSRDSTRHPEGAVRRIPPSAPARTHGSTTGRQHGSHKTGGGGVGARGALERLSKVLFRRPTVTGYDLRRSASLTQGRATGQGAGLRPGICAGYNGRRAGPTAREAPRPTASGTVPPGAAPRTGAPQRPGTGPAGPRPRPARAPGWP